MCNDPFGERSFAETCRAIRRAGYAGIEIAPYTLAEKPAAIISSARRAEYRSIMQSEGLVFVGLHWLMMSPKGLHMTTPDAGLRRRSWDHIRDLIDLCADLGPRGVLIFGSPKQRSTTGGISREEAKRHYIAGLAEIAPPAVTLTQDSH